MKNLFLFLGTVFLLNSKSQAQFKDQLTPYTGNSIISLKSINDINTIAEKDYLNMNTPPDKDQDFYLRRSKNYRIVGWSTLGGGIVLSGLGLLIGSSIHANNIDYGDYTIPGLLLATGAASGIVSIPFMIMATAYKHKAKLMISNQKTGFGVPSGVSRDITGITISFPIGK